MGNLILVKWHLYIEMAPSIRRLVNVQLATPSIIWNYDMQPLGCNWDWTQFIKIILTFSSQKLCIFGCIPRHAISMYLSWTSIAMETSNLDINDQKMFYADGLMHLFALSHQDMDVNLCQYFAQDCVWYGWYKWDKGAQSIYININVVSQRVSMKSITRSQHL